MADQTIDQLNLDININSAKGNVQKVNNLSKSLDKLHASLSQFKRVEFEKVSSYLNQAFGGTVGGGGNNRKPSNRDYNKGLFNLGKWHTIIQYAKRMGTAVYGIAKAGADFGETLNLWNVSMGKHIDTAEKFVKTISKAYGVSESTVMNAQATFKNMLGSLGNISGDTAYQLSEGVTQMALDYASLYNQTFEQAFTKFQAALAGQVRPIRSVSGYDITETTLYPIYQSLGGQKTMRQLNRTEKQLLAIYAIFQQMEATGSVGDLERTLNSFANQSRIAADQWKNITQYSGVLLTHLAEEIGFMNYVNGFLIFISDVLKAAIEAEGALKEETPNEPNIFDGLGESASDANTEIEQLKKSLLSFDKFNALSTPQDEKLAIDQSILKAFEQYQSIISNASMEATEIANSLKIGSGLFGEDGVFNVKKWEEVKSNIEAIGISLGVIFTTELIKKVAAMGIAFNSWYLAVFAIAEIARNIKLAIDAFKEGEHWLGVYRVGIAALISALTAFVLLRDKILIPFTLVTKTGSTTVNLLRGIAPIIIGITAAIGGLALAANGLKDVFDDKLSVNERVIGGLKALAGVLFTIAGVLITIKSAHLGWAAVLAGAGALALLTSGIMSSGKGIGLFADGGLPDKGSLFIAGEAGAEIVTNMGGGQSGVMNMEQLEGAVTRGIVIGLSAMDNKDDRPIVVNIDGQKFFSASRSIYKRNGYDVTPVR